MSKTSFLAFVRRLFSVSLTRCWLKRFVLQMVIAGNEMSASDYVVDSKTVDNGLFEKFSLTVAKRQKQSQKWLFPQVKSQMNLKRFSIRAFLKLFTKLFITFCSRVNHVVQCTIFYVDSRNYGFLIIRKSALLSRAVVQINLFYFSENQIHFHASWLNHNQQFNA